MIIKIGYASTDDAARIDRADPSFARHFAPQNPRQQSETAADGGAAIASRQLPRQRNPALVSSRIALSVLFASAFHRISTLLYTGNEETTAAVVARLLQWELGLGLQRAAEASPHYGSWGFAPRFFF